MRLRSVGARLDEPITWADARHDGASAHPLRPRLGTSVAEDGQAPT
jgi:hypothetical protein